MKKHIILTILITLLSIGTVTSVYASTSGALTQDAISEGLEIGSGESYNPPFGKKDAIGENISTWSGNLNLTQTDLVLPGKNGHDLVIKREYSSQRESHVTWLASYYFDTEIYKPKFLYYDEDGIGQYILFNSEAEMIEEAPDTLGTLTRDKTADPIYEWYSVRSRLKQLTRDNYYEIGNGWRLMLPYLDWMYGYSERFSDVCVAYYKIGEFNNGEGGAYTYWQGDEFITGEGWQPWYLNIDDTNLYECENVSYEDEEHQPGLIYTRIVKDKDGKTMYFNKRGNIVAIDDKYGNRIKFEYNTSHRLTKIIDTYGREITVGSLSGLVNSVSVGDKQITYNKTYRVSDYKHILTVNDVEGNETIYESLKKEPLYDSASPYNKYERKTSTYNITKAIYPTSAVTEYEYEKKDILFNALNTKHLKYKINARKDIMGNNIYNHYTYEYVQMYYDIVWGDATMDLEGADPDWVEDHFKYEPEFVVYLGTIERESDGYTKAEKYNPYGKKIREQWDDTWDVFKIMFDQTDGLDKYVTYNYQYPKRSYCSPRIITEKQYNTNGSAYITTTTQYEYDNKQNITKETKGDYIVDYTYDPDYSNMLTQTYKRDDTHETHIENTLYNNTANPDDPLNGKCVEWTKTYERIYNSAGTQIENNLKSQKQYEYDQNGNITAIHEWDDEGNETITHSTHTYNTNKTYKQETYVANVTDADGQNPQTIKQTNNYDIYGNLATTKDGNNNQTSYTYDKLGRVKTETNPDGTTKTYTYNDTQNYIIIQNENGNKQKIQYDGLGNLKTTYIYNPDNSTWQKQTEHTYDNIGRKQTETLYRKYSDAGQIQEKYTITYTYNSDDTVNTQTTTDISGNIIKKISYTYDYAVNDTINGITDKYNRIAIQQEGDSTITPAPIKQYYDKWGKLVKQEIDHDEDGTTKTYTTTYQYDNIGNKTAEKRPTSP